jgi:TolB-like protein/Flp pilus assembly protein TadD
VTLAAAFSVAAALLGLATYLFWSPDPSLNKSIVVLPFRNLTSDSENAFFAEGVQDDILSRLAKIRDLKVVGRRGAPPIAIGPTTDLRKIGRSLGVRHVLEGSLRRYGDQVMLHVSLIDSSDGREIWSESYDRKLEDAISLQGELASNIADALKAQLTPQERTNVRAPSTHNPDAYVLYLRGRKLENSPTFQIKNYEAAQSLFGQAVALDRKFALAHASLASALGLLYRYRAPSDDLRERAYLEVEEALRLQPDLGEAHLAKGLTDYRVARNFEAAMAEFKVASRLLPNESEPELMTALIQRREGRWREARIGLEHAIARNPLDRKCEEELAATACLLRDWPRAVRHLDKAVAIRPIIQPLRIERVILDVWKRGDLQPLQDELQTVQSFADPEGALTWVRWDAAMLSRDFAKAEGLLLIYPLDTLPSVVGVPIPKSYFQGCVALAAGKYDQARQFLEAARPAMEAEAVAHPNDAMRHARLGLLYAYLGRRNEALREGEKAVELVPVSADAIDGHHWLCNLALIHARVGDISKAIAMIESLLRQPGCVSPLNEASLTLWDLRLRWQWDPLRKDPRFQKILASTEPKTVF